MAYPAARPSPPTKMCKLMAAEKQRGTDFAAAWERSFKDVVWPCTTSERRSWKLALTETREEWAAAYSGIGTRTGHVLGDLRSAA
jgi:hypothetical protein